MGKISHARKENEAILIDGSLHVINYSFFFKKLELDRAVKFKFERVGLV